MTTRTVFKIFGSFGPGGAFVTLTEKLCKGLFSEAYEIGDPTEIKSKEEDELKKVRGEFVNDLFNFKGEFERNSTAIKQERRTEAYQKLGHIFETYKGRMIKLEKQRLARERYYYTQEENDVKYREAIEKQALVEGDVTDNLTKMIVSILKPDLNEMRKWGYQGGADEEEGKIEERISQIRAEEILEIWKKLKVKSEKDNGTGNSLEPLLDTKVNDELYIETGEDVDDIFKAFKHYNLHAKVSDDDRRKY